MRANFTLRHLLATTCCCLLMLLTAGCGTDTAPVQTSPDAIDQYLQENPDEAYTSDNLAEEMDEDEGEG